jgi:hypothetical protein
MKNIMIPAFALLAIVPAVAFAQDQAPLYTDLAGTRALPLDSRTSDPDLSSAPSASALSPDREAQAPQPALSSRGMGAELLQEEVAPRLRFTLAFLARLDVPGDTQVTDTGVAYSDIFDIGYGITVEASLLSWFMPNWAVGGYVALGWDHFTGSSNVDLGTGEFANFNDQDVTTLVIGGKIVDRFGPYFFWEGYMGIGLVHYSELTFTDVTIPGLPNGGLQFFKPVTHGMFELGGRVCIGSPQLQFDMGIDFRFMGAEARGRDVSALVDPDYFFDFIFELGLTIRW